LYPYILLITSLKNTVQFFCKILTNDINKCIGDVCLVYISYPPVTSFTSVLSYWHSHGLTTQWYTEEHTNTSLAAASIDLLQLSSKTIISNQFW